MGVVEVKSLPDAMPSPARETPLQASVVDLRGVGHVLKRRWRWIAAAAAGTGLLVLLATFLMAPRYQASSLVIFDPTSWQLAHGALVLTARAGHKTRLDQTGDGTWSKDAKEGGKPLGLKKL